MRATVVYLSCCLAHAGCDSKTPTKPAHEVDQPVGPEAAPSPAPGPAFAVFNEGVSALLESERLLGRGDIHDSVRKAGVAIEDFERALEIDPSHPAASAFRAHALIFAQRFAESAVAYEAPIEAESNPETKTVYETERAIALLMMTGGFDEGAGEIRRLLAGPQAKSVLEQFNSMFWVRVHIASEIAQRFEDKSSRAEARINLLWAVDAWQLLLELNPGNKGVTTRLAADAARLELLPAARAGAKVP